jgi:hypothetical protein
MFIPQLYRKCAWVGMLALAAVALSVAASAVIVDQGTAHLTGTGDVNDIQVDAVVDLTGGIFTYTYDLTYITGTAAVHIYKVQNPNVVAFFAAANVPLGEPDEFTNPANGSASWVSWTEGNLPVGGSRAFSYQSIYRPQELDVWAYAVDGSDRAIGKTIGMSASIPEPGSIVAVSLGILGLIPMVRRRRA